MMKRKATLRKMSPKARQVAKLLNELESVTRRLKNLIPDIESLEHDSRALANAQPKQPSDQPNTDPLFQEE